MRDEFATCPRCGNALEERPDRCVCGPCGGALVRESVVVAMITEMIEGLEKPGVDDPIPSSAPVELEMVVRHPAHAPITCPRCTTAMMPVRLHGVPVDRCAAHGLWFDDSELATVLGGAPTAHAEPVSRGRRIGMWLAWFFSSRGAGGR